MPLRIANKSGGWEAEHLSGAPNFSSTDSLAQPLEVVTAWSQYFQDRNPCMFYAKDPARTHDSPVGLAYVADDTPGAPAYHVLVLTLNGTYYSFIPSGAVKPGLMRKLLCSSIPSPASVCAKIPRSSSPTAFKFSQCSWKALPLERSAFFQGWEEKEKAHSRCHKVALMYQRPMQTTEEQIFGNAAASETLDRFIDWLGDRVRMKGFTGYRGGLDVRRDHTGPYSCYTKVGAGHEFMFHVSTMLPTSARDPQQVEKKRHCGNDNIVIIFQEDATCDYTEKMFVSNMLMETIVVWPDARDSSKFHFSAMKRRGIESSRPSFCKQGVPLDDVTREWFYTKLVNACECVWQSPELDRKVVRMRRGELEKLAQPLRK